jgi:hypothetical protein
MDECYQLTADFLQEYAVIKGELTIARSLVAAAVHEIAGSPPRPTDSATDDSNTVTIPRTKKAHRGKRGGRKCKKAGTAAKGANVREDTEKPHSDTLAKEEPVLGDSDGEWEVVVEEAREVTRSLGSAEWGRAWGDGWD